MPCLRASEPWLAELVQLPGQHRLQDSQRPQTNQENSQKGHITAPLPRPHYTTIWVKWCILSHSNYSFFSLVTEQGERICTKEHLREWTHNRHSTPTHKMPNERVGKLISAYSTNVAFWIGKHWK